MNKKLHLVWGKMSHIDFLEFMIIVYSFIPLYLLFRLSLIIQDTGLFQMDDSTFKIIWLSFFAFIGIIQSIGFFLKHRLVRSLSHLIAAGNWAVAASVFLGVHNVPVATFSFVIAFACLYLYWKAWCGEK